MQPVAAEYALVSQRLKAEAWTQTETSYEESQVSRAKTAASCLTSDMCHAHGLSRRINEGRLLAPARPRAVAAPALTPPSVMAVSKMRMSSASTAER